jgi:hypothetical protein
VGTLVINGITIYLRNLQKRVLQRAFRSGHSVGASWIELVMTQEQAAQQGLIGEGMANDRGHKFFAVVDTRYDRFGVLYTFYVLIQE